MALDVKVLVLSKGYTDESIAGGGISAGKNCTIQSVTPIPATEVRPAGQRVTFAWYLDNGTTQTSVMDVYNGADGEDGQGIDRMYVNAEGHLVVVYDDGTEEDVGEITIPDFQADWDETDPSENSYIKNKPTIPAAQVNSDWNASSGVAEILNKPNIPTKVSDLQNDSGFEANTIESISVNGTAVIPDANKNVNIVVQGGGGTSDYSDLTNKPSINNVTLSGNKTASDLGLATPSDIVQSDWNEVDTSSKAYIDNKPTLGTAAAKDSTNAVTQSSTDLVESGAVYTELSGKVNTHSTDGVPDRLMTAAEGTKLSGVASGAQVNTIESISVNGSTVSPDANKNVAFTVMTNAVNDLVNYYLKSETYTKTEVDNLISAVTSINFEVVSQLPTTDISTTTIYLVPSDDPGTKNVKDEYICLDTTTTPATWELIGSTDIELSGYVTTSDLNTALADYVLTSTFNTHVATKGDSGVQGHVSLYQGDVSGKTYTSGEAAASAHTHDTRYAPYSVVTDISGKADKVQNATNGHLAGLDSTGNLTDSSYSVSDIIDAANHFTYTNDCNVHGYDGYFSRYSVNEQTTNMPSVPDDMMSGQTSIKGVLEVARVGSQIIQRLIIWYYGADYAPKVNMYERSIHYNSYWMYGNWSRIAKTEEIMGKTDKVANATSGNFAGLDANGNLTDSGHKHSDYMAAMTVDNAPTSGSNNLVSSGGVYTALQDKPNDGDVVHKEGWETITGMKSFFDEQTNFGCKSVGSGFTTTVEIGRMVEQDSDSDAYYCALKFNREGYFSVNGTYDTSTYPGKYVGTVLHIGKCSENPRFVDDFDSTMDIDTANHTVTLPQYYDPATSQNKGVNLIVEGIITVNGSDYAEKFETLEDCPVGRFVTLDGEKIRLAQPGDDYILGVTSEAPAIVGDKDNDGVPVGLVGKLWVESDGTCKVNGFAVSGADGIATDGGSTGYRVMAVDGNRVKILVR